MHECTIGIYYRNDDSGTVTLAELKHEIEETADFNRMCDESGMPEIKNRVYSLTDYADRRKSTNLTRFEYCPYCGKKIDWKTIRRGK